MALIKQIDNDTIEFNLLDGKLHMHVVGVLDCPDAVELVCQKPISDDVALAIIEAGKHFGLDTCEASKIASIRRATQALFR